MLNLNKVQAVQSHQYFDSSAIGERTIDRSLAIFEDYRPQAESRTKFTERVKFNLGIVYFAALAVSLFLLIAL